MTKAQKQEQADAIAKLREWLKPGDTVYTVLEHVSQLRDWADTSSFARPADSIVGQP